MKKIYKITNELEGLGSTFVYRELSDKELALLKDIANELNLVTKKSQFTFEEVKKYYTVNISRHKDCEFTPEQNVNNLTLYIPVDKIKKVKFNNVTILSYTDWFGEQALFTSKDKAEKFRDKWLRKN